MSATFFFADAVLFDMDGTLTDSIAAVEAAWSKVAHEVNEDPAYVIRATHGKRAIDNLAQFKPHLRKDSEEMQQEIIAFEQTILDFADAYNLWGPGSAKEQARPGSPVSPSSTGMNTPALSASSSRSSSFSYTSLSRSSSFSTAWNNAFQTAGSRFPGLMAMTTIPQDDAVQVFDDSEMDAGHRDMFLSENDKTIKEVDASEAWKIEAAAVNRSIKILPGVKRMIESIPGGRYAVATSGAKTYAYGAMTRVGITPPPVTITADDKRLRAGKPAPDPFLLAADCLGFDAKRCVVFEDSPSGIRAGVASGATVIAVCTSHERSKIENCGAHFIVRDMECVKCEVVNENGEQRLKFTVDQ